MMSEAPAGDGGLGGRCRPGGRDVGSPLSCSGSRELGCWVALKAGRSGGPGGGGGTLQSTVIDPRELFSLCEPQPPPPREGGYFSSMGR